VPFTAVPFTAVPFTAVPFTAVPFTAVPLVARASSVRGVALECCPRDPDRAVAVSAGEAALPAAGVFRPARMPDVADVAVWVAAETAELGAAFGAGACRIPAGAPRT
jgi:hypothetical protein